MTIYTDSDQSTHDAAPVEVYKFIGTFNTYRYTSSPQDETVAGEVYTSLRGLRRRSAKAGSQAETNLDLQIEMPFDTDVARDYAFDRSPPRLDLEIRRVHRGDDFAADYILFWKGRVLSFSVQGRKVMLRVPTIFAAALDSNLPGVYYQGPCNHVLFDQRCKLVRSSYNTVTQVAPGVTEGATSIDVLADGFADGLLAGGEMLVQRTGEKRLILDNQADLITISYAFTDIIDNDNVELTRGCNHLFTDATRGCAAFSNQTNFGGYPFIPGDNPFVGSI